jgi:hypothetical protein
VARTILRMADGGWRMADGGWWMVDGGWCGCWCRRCRGSVKSFTTLLMNAPTSRRMESASDRRSGDGDDRSAPRSPCWTRVSTEKPCPSFPNAALPSLRLGNGLGYTDASLRATARTLAAWLGWLKQARERPHDDAPLNTQHPLSCVRAGPPGNAICTTTTARCWRGRALARRCRSEFAYLYQSL